MAGDITAGTLNRLIAVCRDGEEFYGYAARKVSRPQLRALLRATAGLHRRSRMPCGPMSAAPGRRRPRAVRSPANCASSRAV
jgi:hypothetical protein